MHGVTPKVEPETPARALYCLGGAEAPTGLLEDLRCLLRMPAAAIGRIWEVLGPSLAEPVARETEHHLDMFAAAYGVADLDLAHALKACRLLIREAARRDLAPELLAEDLDRLCPEAPLVKDVVLERYEAARLHLRRETIMAAIVDHGKLLTGVKWRAEVIHTSERGTALGMPLATLTLHYREGAKTGRVTLQVLPDMLGELGRVCEAALGRAPRAEA